MSVIIQQGMYKRACSVVLPRVLVYVEQRVYCSVLYERNVMENLSMVIRPFDDLGVFGGSAWWRLFALWMIVILVPSTVQLGDGDCRDTQGDNYHIGNDPDKVDETAKLRGARQKQSHRGKGEK